MKNKEIIIDKINNDEIKVKPRWFFTLRTLGLQICLVTFLIILVLLFDALLFHAFPHNLVFATALILLLTAFLLQKFDFYYQRPFILIIILLTILFLALCLFFCGFDPLIFLV